MKESKSKNLHIQCGVAVDLIIKTSLVRRTLDNVTAVLIAFQNFENYFNGQSTSSQRINDKSYRSNVTDQQQKSAETKKVESNYHSNKENSSFKLKDKFSEEYERREKKDKFINTPQASKASVQLSLNNYNTKKGKDDSNMEIPTDKSVQGKLNINPSFEEGYYKNASTNIAYPESKNLRESFIPSTTKNQKPGSFKGEILKK